MSKKIMILNGPNLNLLGVRQPEIYGTTTLAQIEAISTKKAESLGYAMDFRQTNIEGEMVNALHEARETCAGVIMNAGAYTHTSIALLDAVVAIELPAIELHLSNIHARDEFRHHSYFAKAAVGQICGFGPYGYELAIEAMHNHLSK